jgi:hypothetical protein
MHCRKITPAHVGHTVILDSCPRFGCRGVGIAEAEQLANDISAGYMILPPSIKWDEVAYYVNDKTAMAYVLEDDKLLGNVLDEYYINAVVLPATDNRNEILRKIYARGICYKEVWILGLRGDIKSELAQLSKYNFVSLVLTSDIAKMAYTGQYFLPKGASLDVDFDFTYDLTIPVGCDIITAYNKYCMELWAAGMLPDTIDYFLKEEIQ